MFEKIVIFFMTGTGNSYKVAVWFSEVATALGLNTKKQQIKTEELHLEPDGKTLCVLTLPTHGFTAPWLLLKQIVSLPRGNGASGVVLPSRAGVRIKGVSLPGMEGTAGYLTAFLLFLKGYKIRGVMGVDMPSNWTALHWGLSKKNTQFIISAAEPKVKHFAKTILSGQVYFDGIVPLALGLWLAPISFMYLIMAQLILSKLFFASDKCVGCGLCANYCPKQAIIMTGKTRKRPYWTYSCDSCMACMNYCPYKAVEVSPIVAIIFYYLTTVPISTYLLSSIVTTPVAWLPINWDGIIQYIYILISVFLAYLLLHAALGWRLFSTILSKLSHTSYFRRYHAPDVNLKEFNKEKVDKYNF
ncbi:MAG: 4Fe-4S ferredoxin, iron-sulpur binding protein [Firmicutes bacterium]|nr:4Fe-4S ferredoxin, iron-sulpur binding protein [Bacillota bacterium]